MLPASVLSPVSLVLIARAFLGGLLLFSGVQKLSSFSHFCKIFGAYEIVSTRFVKASAFVVSITEILVGAFLVVGFCVWLMAAVASLLLLLFAGAMWINLLRGRTWLSCGCFGPLGARIHWSLVLRNLILVGIATVTLLYTPRVVFGEPLRLDLSTFCAAAALLLFAGMTLVLDLVSLEHANLDRGAN
jgi:uncharacterized membrane protein YphA (DoxX/SURF4 family)